MKTEQTHYYLIGNEIKKGGEQISKDYPYYKEAVDLWMGYLQPCSITENELCKIKSYLAANTDTPFDLDNHFTCTIEVTDIVYSKPLITETKSGSWTDYEIVFKHPKSEANEAVEFAEWLRKDWQPLAPNKNEWANNKNYEIVKTTELYEIFKTRNNK